MAPLITPACWSTLCFSATEGRRIRHPSGFAGEREVVEIGELSCARQRVIGLVDDGSGRPMMCDEIPLAVLNATEGSPRPSSGVRTPSLMASELIELAYAAATSRGWAAVPWAAR